MVKVLVAFYSRAGNNWFGGSIKDIPVGNTEAFANLLKKQMPEIDLFKIDPVQSYPEDYHECTDFAGKELKEKARPPLKSDLPNFAEYDVICIGGPIWWSHFPMPVFTFMESHDFAGKTVIPFCTHEGSGIASCEDDVKSGCKGAKVLKGVAIVGSDAPTAEKKAKQIIDAIKSL